nr:hypothetical protein [Marinitoga lauensis]
MANGKASKLFIPYDVIGVLGSVATLFEANSVKKDMMSEEKGKEK